MFGVPGRNSSIRQIHFYKPETFITIFLQELRAIQLSALHEEIKSVRPIAKLAPESENEEVSF